MIIENGTIEMKLKTAGGIDPNTGCPVPSSFEYGRPIPCQYLYDSANFRGKTSQGEPAARRSYSILIEEQPISGEQLRLRNKDGYIIGDYSVMSIEELVAVGQIKITV